MTFYRGGIPRKHRKDRELLALFRAIDTTGATRLVARCRAALEDRSVPVMSAEELYPAQPIYDNYRDRAHRPEAAVVEGLDTFLLALADAAQTQVMVAWHLVVTRQNTFVVVTSASITDLIGILAAPPDDLYDLMTGGAMSCVTSLAEEDDS